MALVIDSTKLWIKYFSVERLSEMEPCALVYKLERSSVTLLRVLVVSDDHSRSSNPLPNSTPRYAPHDLTLWSGSRDLTNCSPVVPFSRPGPFKQTKTHAKRPYRYAQVKSILWHVEAPVLSWKLYLLHNKNEKAFETLVSTIRRPEGCEEEREILMRRGFKYCRRYTLFL